MARKARAASSFPILKIKVGTGRDLEVVRAVHDAVPTARLVVDANGAWTPHQAVRTIRDLAPFDLAFVEQPVAAGDLDGLRYVRERVDVPLIADESCATAEDVPRLVGCVDGVNVKLMKCGGLRGALRRDRSRPRPSPARDVRLPHRILLSITAASHLLPLLDFADLDGNLLLAADPFQGVTCDSGRLTLPTAPGLGVHPRQVKGEPPAPRRGRKAPSPGGEGGGGDPSAGR